MNLWERYGHLSRLIKAHGIESGLRGWMYEIPEAGTSDEEAWDIYPAKIAMAIAYYEFHEFWRRPRVATAAGCEWLKAHDAKYIALLRTRNFPAELIKCHEELCRVVQAREMNSISPGGSGNSSTEADFLDEIFKKSAPTMKSRDELMRLGKEYLVKSEQQRLESVVPRYEDDPIRQAYSECDLERQIERINEDIDSAYRHHKKSLDPPLTREHLDLIRVADAKFFTELGEKEYPNLLKDYALDRINSHEISCFNIRSLDENKFSSPDVEQGAPPDTPEPDYATVIKRLAQLSSMAYDRERTLIAKELGVRTSTLDVEVKAARENSTQGTLPYNTVDPWSDPVDGEELLTEITTTVRRFIVCSLDTAYAITLWIAFTWFIDIVQVAPIATITSAEKRCGKTTLLSLLNRLTARAIPASSISPAALYRAVQAWQPTLLIDEADAFLKDNEELRGIINSGHTRDTAFVIRCVGDEHKPEKFSTWGAKVIAGIGRVADTIMDRSIIIELRRKLPGEKVDRIRCADPDLFESLAAKLARFSKDNSEKVRTARPPLPESLNDRAQDNWEPLLAIAMVAGGDWLNIGTAAAEKLSCDDPDNKTIGSELLADILETFETKMVARISSADLIKHLCADEEKPWATFNKGFPIKPRQISSRLKGYGIQSKTIRTGCGETPKGYERDQFNDAFSRYLSATPLSIRNNDTMATSKGLSVADGVSVNGDRIESATPKTTTSIDVAVLRIESPPFDDDLPF